MILAFQHWEGDKEICMKLARLIADIEPAFRNDVSVLFSARFDATHDPATIQYVSKKFPVYTHTSRRRGTGWPVGPNNLMADTFCWCIENTRNKMVKADKILFIESDAVPLHKNWINLLIEEFKASGKQVSGAWLTSGDASCPDHINGNCIISIDFWRKNKGIINPPAGGGWDAMLAPQILPVGHPSKLIWSDYALGTDRNPWKGCDYLWEPKRYPSQNNPLYGQDIYAAWFHGPKHGLGIDCVRQRLGLTSS